MLEGSSELVLSVMATQLLAVVVPACNLCSSLPCARPRLTLMFCLSYGTAYFVQFF
jgi:hypothetical protein